MSENSFTRENLDTYLKELAKEFRKLNGKTLKAEIILVGGAAILANYGFRHMTMDIDAIIYASSAMKEAINKIGNKHNLPYGWLNTDFMKTSSYSPKLTQYSVYYRTYSNVLTIRTITSEYLIAMKLRSGRKYKNDLSDIVGILSEHKKFQNNITINDINKAVYDLYGGWEDFPLDSKQFIEELLENENFEKVYITTKENETISKNLLIQFEENYKNTLTESNLDSILKALKSSQGK